MSETWVPLSVRESGERDAYAGPHEGVPTWLFEPLWAWVQERYPTREGVLETLPRSAAVAEYLAIGTALRLGLVRPRVPGPRDASALEQALYAEATRRTGLLLDVADHWLRGASNGVRDHVQAMVALESLLRSAGSVFEVHRDGPRPYLARRTSKEEGEAASGLVRSDNAAGDHIGRSWRAVFGRGPDASEGYREAVKAVEAASIPIVSPENTRATLGTVIRDLEAAPGSWRLRLGGPSTDEERIERLIGMLKLLWQGQTDRHGVPDDSECVGVALEQAEDALRLALALVGWFEHGAVGKQAAGQ